MKKQLSQAHINNSDRKNKTLLAQINLAATNNHHHHYPHSKPHKPNPITIKPRHTHKIHNLPQGEQQTSTHSNFIKRVFIEVRWKTSLCPDQH